MSPRTWKIVLLVSCAHAMVHVYELSFPSVELSIAGDFGVGKDVMGRLGNSWRLPFGFGALLAGWLVDRFGSKWLLTIYLTGCAATSVAAAWAPSLAMLFIVMFTMGCFASIYHPAGLALISHETEPHQRTRALGYHGIFGSLGIASAPFIAALMLQNAHWQQYYLVLMAPGALLALVIATSLRETPRAPEDRAIDLPPDGGAGQGGLWARWRQTLGAVQGAFWILCLSGVLSGFVYAALMNFLPRYLSGLPLRPEGVGDATFRNLLAAGVLLVGVAGQMAAGRIGRPGKLEKQLFGILLASAPLLVAMALAQGSWRLAAAASVAFVIFMTQPIYNSLIPQFSSPKRRSLAYGFSNTLGFGVGSFGATFAGAFGEGTVYAGLAAVSLASAATVWLLVRRAGQGEPATVVLRSLPPAVSQPIDAGPEPATTR